MLLSFIYYLDLFPPKFGLLHLSFLPSTIAGILLKFKQKCDFYLFILLSQLNICLKYFSFNIFIAFVKLCHSALVSKRIVSTLIFYLSGLD